MIRVEYNPLVRRLGRILLIVLTVLSLLGMVATVVSGFTSLSWSWGDPVAERGHRVSLTRGSLSYRRSTGVRRIVLTHQPGQPGQIRPSVLSEWHGFGFHCSRWVTATST